MLDRKSKSLYPLYPLPFLEVGRCKSLGIGGLRLFYPLTHSTPKGDTYIEKEERAGAAGALNGTRCVCVCLSSNKVGRVGSGT